MISERVSAALSASGLTTSALARQIGISYSALRRKLTGSSAFSIGEVLLVAEALGVAPSAFMTGDDGGTSGRSSRPRWDDGDLESGRVPLWAQLAERLRDGIVEGAFAEGEDLPSEAQLVARFGISRATARNALGQLAAEGLVERRSGKGTRVLPARVMMPLNVLSGFTEDMAARGLQPGYEHPSVTVDAAPDRVAEAFGIPAGAPVVRIQRQLLANGSPIAYSTSWLAPQVIDSDHLDMLRVVTGSLYDWMEKTLGVRITHGTETIEAGLADGLLAARLGIQTGDAVLKAARVARGGDGCAIEYAERGYRADRYRYRAELVRP